MPTQAQRGGRFEYVVVGICFYRRVWGGDVAFYEGGGVGGLGGWRVEEVLCEKNGCGYMKVEGLAEARKRFFSRNFG